MRASISRWVLVVGVGVAGCTADESEGDELSAEVDDGLEGEAGKADGHTLAIRIVPGNIALPTVLLEDEIYRVFESEDELEQVLQISNPGIDFSTEWGVFYNPGLDRLLPGSRAWIDTVWISETGLTFQVRTTLEHNGTECPGRSTRPFRLVAVPAPEDPPPYTRFYRGERTRECALESYDGVPFTEEEVEGALEAANVATPAEIDDAGIKGTQASIILTGRPWMSLAAIADTTNIGPVTMNKLRELGAAF
jgi:hypothetical protein